MTTYGLYDTIPSVEANRIKNILYKNFKLTEALNLDEIQSEYCTLTTAIDNEADGEYIVKSFTINLSNEYFTNQTYYILVNFYDLKTGDITDEHEYDRLISKAFPLTTGDNLITLSEDNPCYLLKDFSLIIKA